MKNKPKVSIVSISYNQEKFIKHTIDSFIEQQTDFSFEVIIADDASTDRTPKIIQDCASKYPDIIRPILRKKNIGAVANSIDSLKAAKGKYVALCEGDDYWTDPNKLQLQVDFLEKNPDYALCFHPVDVLFEGETTHYTFPDNLDKDYFTLSNLLESNYIQTNSVMYRKQTYDNLPEKILPLDWYIHIYHAQFGKIGFINNKMSVYRKHPGGLWWESHKNIDEIWKKHAVEHMRLYIEMIKLFDDNAYYCSIIHNHIGRLINNLIRVDLEQNTTLLKKQLKEFPECTEIFLRSQYNIYKDLESKKIKYDKKIHNLNIAVLEKNRELNEVKNQLRLIQSSKVWRARNKVIKSLGKITTKLNLKKS